jgi:hypothetical protein
MVTQMLDDMVLVDNTFCLGFSQVLSGLLSKCWEGELVFLELVPFFDMTLWDGTT